MAEGDASRTGSLARPASSRAQTSRPVPEARRPGVPPSGGRAPGGGRQRPPAPRPGVRNDPPPAGTPPPLAPPPADQHVPEHKAGDARGENRGKLRHPPLRAEPETGVA